MNNYYDVENQQETNDEENLNKTYHVVKSLKLTV